MPPVLASRNKVTIATSHLQLEELNHTLSHRDPNLLLGVGRSAGEAELTAARDRREAEEQAHTEWVPDARPSASGAIVIPPV